MSAHHADLIARLRAEGRIWREQVGNMPLFDQAADALESILREMHSRELHHFETEKLLVENGIDPDGVRNE